MVADHNMAVDTADRAIEVRAEHALDQERLKQYLAEHLPAGDGSGDLSLAQFDAGQSNPTYLVSFSGKRYVLRKKPPGKLLPSAHAVDREFRIMKALAQTDVPVPNVRVLCDDDSVIGTMFYVMDFIEGRVFKDPGLPSLAASQRGQVFESAATTLAGLHRVDWRAAGLETYGKSSDYIARQIKRWSGQYEASKTEDIADMDNLTAWLRDNMPEDVNEPHNVTIAHGDFRIDNMIYGNDSLQPIAVLDWELSTIGHPLSDFAYCAMMYFTPSDARPSPGLLGLNLNDEGIPSLPEFVAMYADAAGRASVDEINYYMAFSNFRMAAILQGVYKRSLDGNASSRLAGQMGEFVKTVSKTGLRFTDGTLRVN
ncbi:phosphotransferase [Alphaproteobacteria bacterium]|nr:phosphotransferase [Alphaproteobacteria bacterium]